MRIHYKATCIIIQPYFMSPPWMSNQFHGNMHAPFDYSNQIVIRKETGTVLEEFNQFIQNEEAHQRQEFDESGPSIEGYHEAWEALKSRLETEETDKGEYAFLRQNNFLDPTKTATEDEIDDLFGRGMELYRAGRVNEAIEVFEACVQYEQKGLQSDVEANTDSWRMLGVCHSENDEDKKAILCLNHAIECDPYNLKALLALGASIHFGP